MGMEEALPGEGRGGRDTPAILDLDRPKPSGSSCAQVEGTWKPQLACPDPWSWSWSLPLCRGFPEAPLFPGAQENHCCLPVPLAVTTGKI